MVAKGRKRGVHRKQRPRRPLPGMLLHIDGSEHRWFQDERWYDLLVIMDDANSEIYYAQLVEEEATVPVLTGLKEVVERKGVFCALYSDRARHFWLTAKAGEAVDYDRLTQVGRALRELGVRMIPAYSPQARGRSERSFGTWQGRLPQELRLRGIRTVEAANAFLREHYIAEFNRRFQVAAAQPGTAFVPYRGKDLERIFSLQFERTVNRDNTVSFQNLTLQIEPVRWRGNAGGLRRDCAPTLGRDFEPQLWAALPGSLRPAGRSDPQLETGGRQGRGKDARWKSPKTDFPTALGNPAKCAGFPLSHRLGGGGRLTKTGHFTCYEKRTF